MNTAKCPDPGQLIGYALNDGLTGEEHASVERHLPECAACRDEVVALRATLGLVASRVAAAPAPDLRDRVLAQLANRRYLAFFPHRAWVPALAAAGLLFALVGYSLRPDTVSAPVITAATAPPPLIATTTPPATVPPAVVADIEFSKDELSELFDPEELALWQEMDDLSLALNAEPTPDELDEV